MLQKILSRILIPCIIIQSLFPVGIFAVSTDGTANIWTKEKAEHLARKVLFYPTINEVNELYQAGSAVNAINILFPDEEGPDRTQYQQEMSAFTGSEYNSYFGTGNFGWNTNGGNMSRYYLYRYYRDPYQAKAKLSTLFEDIYSVNATPTAIEYGDIVNLHNLLYKHSLGNYKTLVKKVLLNNPNEKGDFAASEFLNLLRQWNTNNPNENYAREMLQLFLMGEYLPGESKENENTRNYSEEDVAALAKILTGFWNDEVADYIDHTVYFSGAKHNNSSNITFLAGNTGSVSFPFYNNVADTLNLSGMTLSIFGNNGLGDNTVDYIFEKRSHAISMFLAHKLYKFYIDENPTSLELESIANYLQEQNFEILPTIKWLLLQDFMYSDESMNSISYYNPLELAIGLFRTLHAQDPETFDTNFYAYSDILSRLGWTPYFPGSIFGRDGFDANYKWISSYSIAQWTNLSMTITADITRTGAYRIDTLIPITTINGRDITMDEMIEQAEDNILLGRNLPLSTKNTIKTYLTTSETGAIIPFTPNNITYKNVKFPGVFALILSQPEFLMKSGYDQGISSSISEPSKLDLSSGSLIVIELPGGYDWLNGIIQKDDYANYASFRADGSGNTIVQSLSGLVDIGDFYMNPYLAYSGGQEQQGSGLKLLYDEGYLKIFNRVGTTKHSRDHDQAQRQIASIDNSTISGRGILGTLSEFDENATHTFVMGSKRPNILNSGNYVNLGTGENRISHSNPKGRLNTNQRNQVVNTIMGSFTGRTYPGKLGDRYKDTLKIHNIANTSVAQGGSAGVGGTTASQLKFVKTLLDNDAGKVFYLQNTGNGYDTHADQLAAVNNLDKGIGKAVSDITVFFEGIKNIHDVTIVVYSEFGRTNYMNGTKGTDHGQGGGVFVITNNPTIHSAWTGSIYGKQISGKERSDWLSPAIDYRSIYGKIIDSIFHIPEGTLFPGYHRTLEDDLSESRAKLPLLHTQYYSTSNTQVVPITKFDIKGTNYNIDKSSYIQSKYSTGGIWKTNTAAFGNERSQNYTRIAKGSDGFWVFDIFPLEKYVGLNEGSVFDYELNPITDQYVENPYHQSIRLPEVLTNSINMVSTGSNSILRKYHGVAVNSTGGYIPSGSGILLASGSTQGVRFNSESGILLEAYSGATYIQKIYSSSGTKTWYGGFIIGENMDSEGFLPENAYINDNNILLKEFTIDRVARIGSDVIGLGMNLDRSVKITLSGSLSNTAYYVLSSQDGIQWEYIGTGTHTSDEYGNVEFDSDHFSLFALAQVPNNPICTLGADRLVVADGTAVHLNWNTIGATTTSISPSVGSVSSSGTLSIVPPGNTSTTYTLSAENQFGSQTCKVDIQSVPMPSCSIQSSQSSIKNGRSAGLSWTGVSAESAMFSPGNTSVPVTANISIIPPPNTTTNYAIQVSNNVGSGTCGTQVTTYPNTAPVAQNDTTNVIQNASAFFDVLANDTDIDVGDTLNIERILTNPSHGTTQINGTGIVYTGNPGYCGTDTFEYRIQDQDAGISNIATVQVHISCGMNPPTSVDENKVITEDATYTGVLNGTDIDGDYLTYYMMTGASFGQVQIQSSGTYTYTPNPDHHGSDSFQYYAYDGSHSGNITTIYFDIQSINDLPLAMNDFGSTNEGNVTVIDILSNDSDTDHRRDELVVQITQSSQSGSAVFSGGMIEYTPNFGICGSDELSYQVIDGSGGISNRATVNINISCINGAPISTADILEISEDTIGHIHFLQNDTDPDFATGSDFLSFNDFQTFPAHGNIQISMSGADSATGSNEIFTYTPNQDYCGTDTFTYRIKDSLGLISNTTAVNITIQCANDLPISPDITILGYSDKTYSGILQSTDIDNQILNYVLVSPPIQGTFTLSSTGYYEYIPPYSTFSGTENIGYQTIDGSGGVSHTGMISLYLSKAQQRVSYTGSDIVGTGVSQIFTGYTLLRDEVLDLNGKIIEAHSNSGNTGSITLPGTLDIIIDAGVWSGDILAPTLLSNNDEKNISISDSGVINHLPADTPYMTYSYIEKGTLKAGSEDAGLALTGGYATIEMIVDYEGVTHGSILQILRSQDGIHWEANSPDTSCMVDNELKCTFRTNHLTYFGMVQQISSPIVIASTAITGGGGGGSMSNSIQWPMRKLSIQSGSSTLFDTQLYKKYSSDTTRYTKGAIRMKDRYDTRYISERIYWNILKKTSSEVTSTTDLVESIGTDLENMDQSYREIAERIRKLWKEKLEWREKLLQKYE